MDFIKEILIPGIKRNQSLETLVYKNLPISRWKADGSQSLFKELLQPLRVLTHLNLSFDTGIYRETFIYLARFARQLQQLKIPSISICHRTDEEEQGEADTPELEQTQLRHLELGSFDFLEEHLLFIPLLKASPELRGLGLPSFQHENTQLVTQVIRDNCPKLTNINLERTHFCLNDDDVAEIIGVCRRSGLRSIQFNRGLRPNSIAALCSYTTTLGSVKIPAYGPGSVQAALHLLRSCPTLRVLKMLTEELNGRDIGIFSAKDLLEDPWVCMELEIFSIPIVDVFNRTADEHIREDIDVGHVVHYDYHQQFYTQLSKLTKLQELSVGISRNCLKSTKTSVLFSLESGLAILSELKNMRLLDVSSTMARIGRKELRWMYDHWPQLEFIKNENVGNCNPWERSFSEDGDDTPLTEELLTLLRYDPDPLADWIYD
ncbi:hypothetical protein BGX27_009386 [Mortierella sp. AM989]|nr:hypothetical protein BGX27_009386 [Mortierella sp. AM989]